MKYVEALLGLLAFLWFSVTSFAVDPGGRRRWQRSAQILLGLSGMAFFGLILYSRCSVGAKAFTSLKAALAGVSIGIFIALWIEGSMNPLKARKPRKNGPSMTGNSHSETGLKGIDRTEPPANPENENHNRA